VDGSICPCVRRPGGEVLAGPARNNNRLGTGFNAWVGRH
jgi:hypothetical protein